MAGNNPVVALESTIITHGMPKPQNLETAVKVEEIVRQEGAVPATIAVLNGRLRIGLDAESLDYLAACENVIKLSRSNLSLAISQGLTGSTTVSATMLAANLAGIRIMATGGIGGVHVDAESSFDISADLDELEKTPVAVVAAGAKALLDLPKTLEYLESRGVPVVGFNTDDFPAFWSRSCGLPIPIRIDSIDDIANLIKIRNRLPKHGGELITNPVPVDYEIPYSEMKVHISMALDDAKKQNISGSDLTPHVLAKIEELTQGKSLVTNIALVKNNALLAAQIAKSLSTGI